MRSHRSTQKIAPKKRKKNSIAASYSLRENPKKSSKFSPPLDSQNAPASVSLQENHCKICGKGFDSSKALFGHMRHHSGRRKEPKQNSNLKTLSCQSPVVGGQSDGGETLGPLRRKRSRRTRCNPYCCASDLGEFSSSSANVDGNIEPDVEELAVCLLMLSKGVGNFGDGFSSESIGGSHFSVFEAKSPLNRRAATHFDLDSRNGDENVKLGLFPEIERYYTEVELRMPKLEDIESEMAFVEEEMSKKGLKCLKKCLKKCEEEEEDEEMEKEGNHQCHVCLKVFGTGQALGGHKRAHILKPDLMELEEEEDDDDEFKPWWNGDDDNGGQQLLGSLVSSK